MADSSSSSILTGFAKDIADGQAGVLTAASNQLTAAILSLNTTLQTMPIISIDRLPHGVLETARVNGIAIKKTFWTTFAYKTDSNGLASCYLTTDNTLNGPAIFSEIWYNQSRGTGVVNNPNALVFGMPNGTGTIKNNIHIFSQGNTQNLGTTLLTIAGTIINGMKLPVAGTPIQFKVEGV